MEWLGNNK
jgi:hypothetical protein